MFYHSAGLNTGKLSKLEIKVFLSGKKRKKKSPLQLGFFITDEITLTRRSYKIIGREYFGSTIHTATSRLLLLK